MGESVVIVVMVGEDVADVEGGFPTLLRLEHNRSHIRTTAKRLDVFGRESRVDVFVPWQKALHHLVDFVQRDGVGLLFAGKGV